MCACVCSRENPVGRGGREPPFKVERRGTVCQSPYSSFLMRCHVGKKIDKVVKCSGDIILADAVAANKCQRISNLVQAVQTRCRISPPDTPLLLSALHTSLFISGGTIEEGTSPPLAEWERRTHGYCTGKNGFKKPSALYVYAPLSETGEEIPSTHTLPPFPVPFNRRECEEFLLRFPPFSAAVAFFLSRLSSNSTRFYCYSLSACGHICV